MNPPLVPWRKIGDAMDIRPNKKLILWGVLSGSVFGTVELSETDDRGDLWNEDMTDRMDWADFTHYCYVGMPLE
jgi:hypothetical protein